MTTEYIKDSEGKVSVIETIVKDPVVKDLHQMVLRKIELEGNIAGRRALFVQQKAIEMAAAEKQVDAELNGMQAELDKVQADIDGAVAAGVIEIVPADEVVPVNTDPGAGVVG